MSSGIRMILLSAGLACTGLMSFPAGLGHNGRATAIRGEPEPRPFCFSPEAVQTPFCRRPAIFTGRQRGEGPALAATVIRRGKDPGYNTSIWISLGLAFSSLGSTTSKTPSL